jgi:hypothetical protein
VVQNEISSPDWDANASTFFVVEDLQNMAKRRDALNARICMKMFVTA